MSVIKKLNFLIPLLVLSTSCEKESFGGDVECPPKLETIIYVGFRTESNISEKFTCEMMNTVDPNSYRYYFYKYSERPTNPQLEPIRIEKDSSLNGYIGKIKVTGKITRDSIFISYEDSGKFFRFNGLKIK